eukprot:comp20214_c0_seq1/m.25140 comp20214_c0_seq1/g.25140  ORF comp20214_c0_seq1/g.25140 comp20214_c0_seq1/m.25140 type:complete len:520 (-) comp20214_c0_seq1:381-1940(-)
MAEPNRKRTMEAVQTTPPKKNKVESGDSPSEQEDNGKKKVAALHRGLPSPLKPKQAAAVFETSSVDCESDGDRGKEPGGARSIDAQQDDTASVGKEQQHANAHTEESTHQAGGGGRAKPPKIRDPLGYRLTDVMDTKGDLMYGTAYCPYKVPDLTDEESEVFAAVGSNKVYVLEVTSDGHMNTLYLFEDEDTEEEYYSVAFTCHWETYQPLVVVGGKCGLIRVISLAEKRVIRTLIGHGDYINDLRVHPLDHRLLLSASKDHSCRLWNIVNSLTVAVLAGADGAHEGGHRDQVLSADFNLEGDKVVSGGTDNCVKIWDLGTPRTQEAIRKSMEVSCEQDDTRMGADVLIHRMDTFRAVLEPHPIFSTNAVHKNYVDCVRWLGDMIMSKSAVNETVDTNHIKIWAPYQRRKKLMHVEETELYQHRGHPVQVLSKLSFSNCHIFFLRFSTDRCQRILACGNQIGTLHVWLLEPGREKFRTRAFTHKATANKVIRQTAVSNSGRDIVCVSDKGNVFLWQLQP